MTTLEWARSYVAAGLSVIPIRPDGSKAPALDTWKEFRERLPGAEELERWFGRDTAHGIAVVCGRASGGLEVIDFDSADAYDEWRLLVEAHLPGALDRLPRVRTPGGGAHVYVRRPRCGGNRKLARDEAGKTLIEVRGHGGYVLAPGCPAECHPSGGLYRWEVGLEDAGLAVA